MKKDRRGFTLVELIVCIAIVAILATLMVGGCARMALRHAADVTGGIQELKEVAHEEIGFRALNEKYEWFKNQYAGMAAMRANLDVQYATLVETKSDYEPWTSAPMDVREDYRMTRTEASGMKFKYNALAAQYNAEMSKIHTAFMNTGKLPVGGKDQPPREVAEYIYQ